MNKDGAPLLEIRNLTKHFPVRRALFDSARAFVSAVDDVSITVHRGETLALVGESGCGKSTVARLVLRLIDPTSGEIIVGGTRIDRLGEGAMRPLRRQIQIVFQDPFSSLDPAMRVRDILAEPIVNFGLARTGAEIDRRIADLLAKVQLPVDAMARYPHEFSGGQRQRIGIARALAPGPSLIVCDEAVSALDVSVKAQIINLLADLQDEFGLALLFISHDLAVVEHLTHRVAVMYLGRIVELADRRTLFGAPRHPYTQALLSAVPVPDPAVKRARIILKGEIPSAVDPPKGCHFNTRCPYAFERCFAEQPALREADPAGHSVACHLDVIPQPAKVGRSRAN
jgi:peptide/nickel transport system ATP-binding protein